MQKIPFDLRQGSFTTDSENHSGKIAEVFQADALKAWFLNEGRDLPWRKSPTPYAVWISEIMLQQTQVAVVIDYFSRWMARFPNVHALAAAPLEEVIKMWEGLGYYSRARNLHAAACHIVERHRGEIPSTRAELSEIQGIGPYTVGAILSFAFKQKAAAVDGNVIRVLSRYFAIEEDVGLGSTRKKIWAVAEKILPEEEPWLVAEGLIELGATVCKREAHCWACPLRPGCASFRRGIQGELPKIEKKVEITSLLREVFVVSHEGALLLKKGEEGKVMAGLYEFPYRDKKVKGFPFSFDAKKVVKLPVVEHSFTRFKVKLHPTLWKAIQRAELPGHQWIPFKEVHRYPFSSGHRRILQQLREDHADITH
ncbi:MAG: A/G-specific adenine glycosylase [Verrucomicrobia bacterium]|nr:A/G-specific adenine glycosylase [Verrucomicrobiota bacterium]